MWSHVVCEITQVKHFGLVLVSRYCNVVHLCLFCQIHGPMVLQIQKVRNISAPKANEDSGVAPPLLRLQLTDGHTTVMAVVLNSISKIRYSQRVGSRTIMHWKNTHVRRVWALRPKWFCEDWCILQANGKIYWMSKFAFYCFFLHPIYWFIICMVSVYFWHFLWEIHVTMLPCHPD